MTDRHVHAALMREVRRAEAAGSVLPGELELVDRLGCSRQQLRHALAELEQHGVLRRRQGAVTTVDPVGLRLNIRLEEQLDYTQLLSRLGYEAGVQVLDVSHAPVPAEAARLLGAPPGSPALHRTKLFTADGTPVMLVRGVLLLPDDSPRTLDDSIGLAVTQAWGEPLVWEVSTPGAAVPSPADAGLLALAAGSPVMTFEHIGICASGRRVFHAVEQHVPGAARFTFLRTKRFPGAPG